MSRRNRFDPIDILAFLETEIQVYMVLYASAQCSEETNKTTIFR